MNQFRAAFASIVVLTVFLTGLGPDAVRAQTGPAGVGNADGTASQPRNVLWLRGDQGAQDAGGQLLQWNDQSGNGNHATPPSGSAPALSESAISGLPAASFGGSSYLTIPDDASLDGADEVTLFLALRAEQSASRMLSKRDGSNSVSYELAIDKSCITIIFFDYCSNYFRFSVGSDASRIEDSAGGLDFGGAQILSAGSNGTAGRIFRNGQQLAQGGLPAVNDTNDPLAIGARSDGSEAFQGEIAEVIVYNSAVNTTRRTIIENYLAAKYDVWGLNSDVYSDATTFTQNVFGIGQHASNDSHESAEGAGLRLDSKTGLNDGDYLLAGHNVANNSLETSDVSGLGSQPARSSRVWFIDKTDSGSDLVVDVTFDLSEMGLSGQATSTNDYALIRSSSSGPFSWNKVRQQADAVGNSDQITFRDVSLNDGEYYTVMTEDQTQSELDSRALVIQGLEGNEASGSENGGAGGDAGWRMLGVPVSGASAGDLQTEVDSQLLEFWMQMMYGWDADQGQWDPLQQASDPIINGRGYVLYLFDNEQARFEPIDPTLTIDVNGGSEVTSQSVTVGDGAPSGDVALNTDSTWHLLANPYVKSYNLSALNLDVNADGDGLLADFQSTVQIWDPSVQSYVLRNNTPFNRTVAPWQAFFVERGDFDSNAASQLTFSDAGTTTGGSFIGSKSASQSYRHLGLRVIARNTSGTEIARDDAASLLFHPAASTEKDFYDASKLEPFATSYVALAPTSTGANGEKVLRAQRSLPYSLNEPMTIPLDFQMKNLNPSEVAISTSEWRGIPGSWAVTLVDTKGTTDTSDDVEISWGSDSTYTFAPASPKSRAAGPKAGAVSERAEDGTPRPDIRTLPHSLATTPRSKATSNSDTTRFVLKVDPGGQPLPVEMATFDAESDGEELVLRWRTASETNNAGFYVQHQRLPADDSAATPSAEAWTRKTFVDGAGTTDSPQSYRHRLSGLEYGRHAFRLRQVDNDGDVTLSEVVEAEVRLKSDHEVTAPYPNPVRQQATVDVAVRESQPVRVTMYDVLGRRIRTVYDDELAAQRTKKIRIGVQDLASGVYFVRVKGDGFTETTKMTVVQ